MYNMLQVAISLYYNLEIIVHFVNAHMYELI